MTTVVLAVALVAVIMLAMAIGVMVSGRRLRGSCGGAADGTCECKAAGLDPSKQSCPRAAPRR